MGYGKYGPETSYEERNHHRMQVVYTHKMQERQVFMEELKDIRKKKEKKLVAAIKKMVGPKWYQALSVPQRIALDSLERSIYQDLLEGRPVRTAGVMKNLGLFPHPNALDLMNCVYLGRKDPKEMLAQLFLMSYGHTIDGRQSEYCLNARLMLSGIYYLGLEDLIRLLRERFKPPPETKKATHKPKPKIEPPLESPYLQNMIAVLYERPKRKPFRPAPLPNLDDLNNEPYEEEVVVPKPPPPPPPPPPPTKKLPRSFCDKIAGVMRIEPHTSITTMSLKTVTRTSHKKIRGSKMCLTEVKKSYGIGGSMAQKTRRKKPIAPTTGMWNAQYVISGVYTVRGKSVFVLASVSILPAHGELIHGGHKFYGGECINIHCGFRAKPPPPKPEPCDCAKWTDTIFQYVRNTKCYCGHHYDYGNEGRFMPDELPYFEKPTRHVPHVFNYQTIFDLDAKRLHVEKDFKRLWDTDSMLRVDDGSNKKKDKKKKKKRSSTTCLGQKPKAEDYLKCALQQMRRVNIAAHLPDLHMAPELSEWMRKRIHGPYSRREKNNLLLKSNLFWDLFKLLATRGFGHVYPPADPQYTGLTNWIHKQKLNDKFRTYTHQYRLEMYRSYAYVTNMMWPSMYQAQFPDKKFREIYFSYLFANLDDLQLMHPFSSKEAIERKFIMARKRYCCQPDGIEPET